MVGAPLGPEGGTPAAADAIAGAGALPPLPVGVLVSGNGSNLQAILDAVASGVLPLDVRLVVSNRPGVRALERAERAGVAWRCIPHREYPSREAFDAALVAALADAGVRWVVLAGFMRILTPVFLRAFPHRTINLHPSLLPAFPGAHAIADALAHGVTVTGCTVHVVDEGLDSGPILGQRAVEVSPDDDEASLAERIHAAEHALLVECLRGLATGALVVEGDPGQRARVRRSPGSGARST